MALLFYDGKVGDHTTPGRRNALLASTSELAIAEPVLDPEPPVLAQVSSYRMIP